MKLFLTRLLIILLSVSIEGFNFYKYNFNVNIKKGLDSSIINFIRIHNVNFIRIRENPKYLILRYLHEPIEDIIGNNENDKNNEKKNNKKLIVLKDNKNFIKVIDNSYSNNYNKDKGVIINDVRTDNYNYYYHYDYNNDYSNSDDYENYNNMMDEENEKSYFNNNYDIYELIKNNKKPIIISYEKKKEDRTLNYKYSYLIYNTTSYLSKYTLSYNNINYRYHFNINATEVNDHETRWDICSTYNSKYNNNVTKSYIKNWIEYNINNNYNYYYYKKYLLFNYYFNRYLY